MRRGEIAALQWSDIDLDNNCIHVNHSIMEINGRCTLDTPKTESSLRTIYISPSMTAILRKHRKNATGKYVFPAITNLDKPMMPSRIYTLFSKVIESVGLKCKFHTLRHTHITQLLENGVNIKTIQDRVGHTQISTTMGYCHPSKEKDKAAAAIFDQFIK
jgi:integrase